MLALQPKIIVFLLRPFYTVTAGMSWRKRYGDFKMVHTHHTRWSKGDVWKKVFEMLAEEANNEYSMIDSTIVRVYQPSAGAKKYLTEDQAIGRSKGGLSTKIQATCDVLGNLA